MIEILFDKSREFHENINEVDDFRDFPDSLTETVWKAFGKGDEFGSLAAKGLNTAQVRKIAKLVGRFPGRSIENIGNIILKNGKVVVDLKLDAFNPTRLDEAKMMIENLPIQKIGEMTAFIKKESSYAIVKTTVVKLLNPDPTELDVLGALYDIYDWTTEIQ